MTGGILGLPIQSCHLDGGSYRHIRKYHHRIHLALSSPTFFLFGFTFFISSFLQFFILFILTSSIVLSFLSLSLSSCSFCLSSTSQFTNRLSIPPTPFLPNSRLVSPLSTLLSLLIGSPFRSVLLNCRFFPSQINSIQFL